MCPAFLVAVTYSLRSPGRGGLDFPRVSVCPPTGCKGVCLRRSYMLELVAADNLKNVYLSLQTFKRLP